MGSPGLPQHRLGFLTPNVKCLASSSQKQRMGALWSPDFPVGYNKGMRDTTVLLAPRLGEVGGRLLEADAPRHGPTWVLLLSQ